MNKIEDGNNLTDNNMMDDNKFFDDKKYTAAVINLGCKVNRYEADSMKELMANAGILIVEPEDIADFYIVNTCSVTNIAERKSRQMLRRAKRRNPEAFVIAAGCYVNAAHEKLLELDFVDAVIGNDNKKNIVKVLDECIKVKYQKADKAADVVNVSNNVDIYTEISASNSFEEMGGLTSSYLDHQRAYIKIQDGCNQFCSYCIIPYTRGRIRSREPQSIIDEITGLARSGVKEFVLTGIHISSYGKDIYDKSVSSFAERMEGIGEGDAKPDEFVGRGGNDIPAEYSDKTMSVNGKPITDLADIVCAISDIPEVERVRLGSLEPRIITKDFLDRLKKAEKLCPHFHLSLQSACNETLKRMNRKYSIEEYMECVADIRRYYDKPAITTDVIVGFPGETEEEFHTTVENLKKLELYEIHVFKYSVRHGTVAEKLPCQVPENIKNERSDVLLELTAEQKLRYESSLAGLSDEVLVEEEVEGASDYGKALGERELHFERGSKMFTGHTKRYVRVNVESDRDIVGEIVTYTF